MATHCITDLILPQLVSCLIIFDGACANLKISLGSFRLDPDVHIVAACPGFGGVSIECCSEVFKIRLLRVIRTCEALCRDYTGLDSEAYNYNT